MDQDLLGLRNKDFILHFSGLNIGLQDFHFLHEIAGILEVGRRPCAGSNIPALCLADFGQAGTLGCRDITLEPVLASGAVLGRAPGILGQFAFKQSAVEINSAVRITQVLIGLGRIQIVLARAALRIQHIVEGERLIGRVSYCRRGVDADMYASVVTAHGTAQIRSFNDLDSITDGLKVNPFGVGQLVGIYAHLDVLRCGGDDRVRHQPGAAQFTGADTFNLSINVDGLLRYGDRHLGQLLSAVRSDLADEFRRLNLEGFDRLEDLIDSGQRFRTA